MVVFTSIPGIPVFTKGLGYSPASGPSVGGPVAMLPAGNFYGFNLSDILPNYLPPRSNKFGNKVNLVAFPGLGAFPGEVGPGNTPGGLGGVNGPILYGTNTLLGFQASYGKRKRKSRKTRQTRQRKTHRSFRSFGTRSRRKNKKNK